MSDLLTHYAISTGALSSALFYAETSLRVALQCNRTEAGLRRSMVELLASVERANAEHKVRKRVRPGTLEKVVQKRAQLERVLGADTNVHGLSLVEVEHAVKAGAATIEDYRARAAALGYAPADVAMLVTVLEQERAAHADAEARRAQIETELQPRALSLSHLEAAVQAGLKTLAQYEADVVALGYTLDDADLLAAVLETKLAPVAAA